MKKLLISKCVWTALAIALWVGGLCIFIKNLKIDNWLMGYFIWGTLCAICIIKLVLSLAKNQGKIGRAKGANEYSVTDNGSHYTVQNHPFRGAVIGFITGLLADIVAGPIIVPINVLVNIVVIIKILINKGM